MALLFRQTLWLLVLLLLSGNECVGCFTGIAQQTKGGDVSSGQQKSLDNFCLAQFPERAGAALFGSIELNFDDIPNIDHTGE